MYWKKCLDSIIKNIGVPVILITPDNLDLYILKKHPLHKGYQYLSETHKADYLRTYFMHHYGGGYTDIKMTNTNWSKYFAILSKSNYIGIGYKEKKNGSPIKNLDTNKLIGNGSYIFKPHTNMTNEWYNNMLKKMNEKYEDLKKIHHKEQMIKMVLMVQNIH